MNCRERNVQTINRASSFARFGESLVPSESDGSGVKIAVLDTGIDIGHPYIQRNWHQPLYGKDETKTLFDRGYKDFV
jgi:hypothetical protein